MIAFLVAAVRDTSHKHVLTPQGHQAIPPPVLCCRCSPLQIDCYCKDELCLLFTSVHEESSKLGPSQELMLVDARLFPHISLAGGLP